MKILSSFGSKKDIFGYLKVGNLVHLKDLDLGGTMMTSLPEEFKKLEYLTSLNLSGVKWPDSHDTRSLLSQRGFMEFLSRSPVTKTMSQEVSRKVYFNM